MTQFEVDTLSTFICGTPIDFVVTVRSGRRSFAMPFRLPSGSSVGTFARFDYNGPGVQLPDNNARGVDFPFQVSGFDGAIGKVKVSVFADKSTYIGDLVFTLISPDGTRTILSANVGGTNTTFGSGPGDAQRCTFDDSASTPISDAQPPYAGTYKPQQPLSRFNGKAGTKANGTWILNVADVGPADLSTFEVGSLFIAPANCTDGGAAF